MALIERKETITKKNLSVNLNEVTVYELQRYAAWLNRDTPDCLELILQRHLSLDKDWQAEKAAQDGKVIAVPMRRGRKAKAEQVA